MIRFKKQFLFLFSFLFKIPAILSQQEVSNINVSQESFSSFSFFLSFFFLFYLRKCLSRRTEAYNKVHSLIYYWWNRIFLVSLFLFWIHITFQFLGICTRKTVKLYLSLTRFNVQVPFSLFYGWVTSPKSAESAPFPADFCPKSKESFYGRLSPKLAVNQHVFLRWLLSPNWRFFSKFL